MFHLTSLRLGSAWMLVASLLFALMGACVNLAAHYFSFYELVFYRSLFALIVLSALALYRRQSIRTPYLGGQLLRGLTGSVSLMCYFYALSHLPLATAMTLSHTSSIWLALFSMLFFTQTRAGGRLCLACPWLDWHCVFAQPDL